MDRQRGYQLVVRVCLAFTSFLVHSEDTAGIHHHVRPRADDSQLQQHCRGGPVVAYI